VSLFLDHFFPQFACDMGAGKSDEFIWSSMGNWTINSTEIV
jgi:hypothetical protein